MPRTYTPKRVKTYTEQDIQNALDVLTTQPEEGEIVPSIQSVADQFKIPRKTLSERLLSFKSKGITNKVGRPPEIPPEAEEYLVTGIELAGDYGWPMDRNDIKKTVGIYCDTLNLKTRFKDNMPGKDWMIAFHRRWKHRLSARMAETLTAQRAKGLTRESKEEFFAQVNITLTNLGIKDIKHRIFNLDEIGMNTCASNKQQFFRRGGKDALNLQPSEGKTNYTVMFTCNAGGDLLPPYVIYKGTPSQIQDTWMLGGPQGTVYNVTKSGWMEDYVFTEWLTSAFVPWLKKQNICLPVILFFDGHASHLTYALVQIALKHGIHLYCIPPHTSHILQPLDVGVYGPTKVFWKKILKAFYRESRLKKVTKAVFPSLLKSLFERMVQAPGNIVNSFVKTGLCPLDPSKVPVSKLLPSEPFQVNPAPQVSQANSQKIGLASASQETAGPSSIRDVGLPHDTSLPEPIVVTGPSSPLFRTHCSSLGRPRSMATIPVTAAPPEPMVVLTPRKAMRLAICSAISPEPSAMTKSGLSNDSKRRKRVQKAIGECLTEPEAMERLRVEEEEKRAKKQKTNANRPRAITAKKSLSLGLTMKDKQLQASQQSVPTLVENEPDPLYHIQKVTNIDSLKPGDYISVVYDKKWYLAAVVLVNKDQDDVQVRCMTPSGPTTKFTWPLMDDECIIPKKNILGKLLKELSATDSRGRYFTIADDTQDEIESVFVKSLIQNSVGL